MARLARLSLARHAHLVALRGHNGEAVFRDDEDRLAFLTALRMAFSREPVALHAYALADRVWLLCTPSEPQGLSRAMQSVGRRFSAVFNRRHQRTGSLWDGRYRSTVIEPGAALLDAMVFVDQLLTDAAGLEGRQPEPLPWSSARQHLGYEGVIALTDLAEYWALGNTPFDRASAFRRLLNERRGDARLEGIAQAAEKGWAYGTATFIQEIQRRIERPVAPRPRGRPRKG